MRSAETKALGYERGKREFTGLVLHEMWLVPAAHMLSCWNVPGGYRQCCKRVFAALRPKHVAVFQHVVCMGLRLGVHLGEDALQASELRLPAPSHI